MGYVSYGLMLQYFGLGADLSLPPSLPVGDDRYLSLRSQKRPTSRNLGGNRSVRRSGTTSRDTVVVVFCLRMRRFPLTLPYVYIMSKNGNTWPLFKICFLKIFELIVFCTVRIKDSCIVDIENRRFYLLFLRLI